MTVMRRLRLPRKQRKLRKRLQRNLLNKLLKVGMKINPLWLSDAIWRHRSGSTLAHAMACCLPAPSHYLNQCWFLIDEVLWHSFESNFIVSAKATMLYNEVQNDTFKITATSPRGQWVNLVVGCKHRLQWFGIFQVAPYAEHMRGDLKHPEPFAHPFSTSILNIIHLQLDA